MHKRKHDDRSVNASKEDNVKASEKSSSIKNQKLKCKHGNVPGTAKHSNDDMSLNASEGDTTQAFERRFGWDETENTWEPQQNLFYATDLVEDFIFSRLPNRATINETINTRSGGIYHRTTNNSRTIDATTMVDKGTIDRAANAKLQIHGPDQMVQPVRL
ncbi:hypothetical protein P8452_55312 [Trifolium repens]|nr:hypothetical protein P8452_55312 [Trifolium repens]